MKIAILFSAISFFCIAPLGAHADSLQNFEFKGVAAGVDTDPKSIGHCNDPSEKGVVKCSFARKSVAGVGMDAPEIFFYNNRLHRLQYRFNTNNFDKLNKSLTEKYGAPCDHGSEDWQSAGGQTMDNPIVYWCFKTGKLTLKAMEKGVLYGSLIYVDNNKPSSEKPVVDF